MHNPASFSVIIPTAGRESIYRTIHSIGQQLLGDGDEVLIIFDGTDEGTGKITEAVEAIGKPFRTVDGKKTSDWGHSQLNLGMEMANGTHILAIDDDDVYTPRAFERIRSIVSDDPTGLHLFRFWTNDRVLRWERHKKRIEETCVGGHCLPCPNIKGKTGKWTARYLGDLDWIRSVVAEHDRPPTWEEAVIARQRPRSPLREWSVLDNPKMLDELRIARNECAEYMTSFRDQITEEQQVRFGSLLKKEPVDHYAYVYTTPDLPGETVGFVYVGKRGEKRYLTYGLKRRFRGLGYGRWLIESASDSTEDALYADVLRSNLPSFYTLKDQGFREIDITDEGDIRHLARYNP